MGPVIKWFKSIENEIAYKFFKFDIVVLYPFIRENLLNIALQFAEEYAHIDPEQLSMIKHCRKFTLYEECKCRVKKKNAVFNVAMWSYDGAEVCKLLGLFLIVD